MGGAVAIGGNVTAAAEFNAWMDPLAADEVLTCGVPMKMVPLDITSRFAWGERQISAIAEASAMAQPLSAAARFLRDRDGVFVPHDAVAAVALLEPKLFSWSQRSVRCETAGSVTSGATVVDRRAWVEGGSVSVADDVDCARVDERILAAITELAT